MILYISAIETPGGKRILVKNIIAQQITRKGLIPRALFLGEMRNISPVSFEL